MRFDNLKICYSNINLIVALQASFTLYSVFGS